jgi:hypothetical protein
MVESRALLPLKGVALPDRRRSANRRTGACTACRRRGTSPVQVKASRVTIGILMRNNCHSGGRRR